MMPCAFSSTWADEPKPLILTNGVRYLAFSEADGPEVLYRLRLWQIANDQVSLRAWQVTNLMALVDAERATTATLQAQLDISRNRADVERKQALVVPVLTGVAGLLVGAVAGVVLISAVKR